MGQVETHFGSLGDSVKLGVGQVEACFGPFGDIINLGTR
jgi:hypothetical protein